MQSLCVSLGVHKYFVVISFPSLLPYSSPRHQTPNPMISNTLQFHGASLFWSFSQKAWDYSALPCTSITMSTSLGPKQLENRETEKNGGFGPHALGTTALLSPEIGPLPQNFGPSDCLAIWGLWAENRKKGEKWVMFPHSLSIRSSLSCFLRQSYRESPGCFSALSACWQCEFRFGT